MKEGTQKMEVIIQMPLHNLPLAEPCCFMCYKKETHENMFMDVKLVCGCSPHLHEACVVKWKQLSSLTQKPLCPNCGKEWIEQKTCCEICLWFTSVLSCLTLLIVLSVVYIMKLL